MGIRRVLALAILAVLINARPAHADWWDFIWEMSGTQMIGIGVSCEWSLQSEAWRCDIPLKRLPGVLRRDNQGKDHWWAKASSYYYFSTAKNGYDSGKVLGFGVDPMVVYAWYAGRWRITHGAGISLQRFWSADWVESIDNVSYKIQPASAEVGIGGTAKLKLTYNLRYFWDGFASAPPVMSRQEKSEGTQGFVISVTF